MKDFKYKNSFKSLIYILLIILIVSGLVMVLPNKAYKLKLTFENFYEMSNQNEFIIVGSSSTYNALNPTIMDEITGKDSYNLATPAQSLEDTYYLVKNIYEKYTPQNIIIGLNTPLFQFEQDNEASRILLSVLDNSWSKIEYFFSCFDIYEFFYFFNKEPLSFSLMHIIDGEYLYNLINYKELEKQINKEINQNTKGYISNEKEYSEDVKIEYYFDVSRENERYLKKIVKLCKEKGSNIILFTAPLSPTQKNSTEELQQYNEYLNNIANEYDIINLDFNLLKKELFPHTYEYFADDLHIRHTGAEIVSNVMGNLLNDINNGSYDVSEYFYDNYKISHDEKFQ